MNALAVVFSWPALAAALVMPAAVVLLLAAGGLWRARNGAGPNEPDEAQAAPSDELLVLHASQTGNARTLAQDTGEWLRRAGLPVRVQGLGVTTVADLRAHARWLLVLATTGDGDAPDAAEPFVREVLDSRAARRAALGRHRFALLALGDSRYSDFCGFGRRVDHWLRRRGAKPLFERVEIDGWDGGGLLRWRAGLADLADAGPADALPPWPGDADAPESAAQPWRLVDRRLLNPRSLGEPLWHVELEPAAGAPLPAWEAGDLARLLVPGQYRPRDYSVASIPADGRLHLTVRRMPLRSGKPGAASGWLGEAPLGSEAPLQLVAHLSFRLGENASRPLILVGNGAGIEGLRGPLRARASRAGARHWLLFGERQRAYDFVYRDEVEGWQRDGVIERLDLAFSRDGDAPVYVQQCLREAAGALREWVAGGAAIYVCGGRAGMGEGVHAALVELLGGEAMRALAAQGRYRRDVY